VEQKGGETLSYYGYPSTHWRQIKTNDPLERIFCETRRRTRMVGAFPDGHSALMLAAARLRHIASTKCGKRRYMIMDPLLNPAKQEEAAAWAPELLPGLPPARLHCGFTVDEETRSSHHQQRAQHPSHHKIFRW